MDGELIWRNAQGRAQAVFANRQTERVKFCGERGCLARSVWRPAKHIWRKPVGETPAGATGTVALTLVGWSNIPQYVEATEKNKNYHITIERLDPHQSIEFIFRGHKTIHESEIGIASSWTFDKAKVAIFVLCTLVVILAFYYGDYLHIRLKPFIVRAQ